MIGTSIRVMQTFMITGITRHQQCFSTRNTKLNGKKNAAPIMQRSPETGVAMRREMIVNVCVFIEYLKVHIYSSETLYFI
jgi:hypothetical protein